MKPRIISKTLACLMAVSVPACMTSCVETSTTAPDGTVTVTKAPAPGSLELAGQAITVIGARRVEATK